MSRSTAELERLERELEQLDKEEGEEMLKMFNNRMLTCQICHESTATHRVERESWDTAVCDVWHEYVCDDCYQEQFA